MHDNKPPSRKGVLRILACVAALVAVLRTVYFPLPVMLLRQQQQLEKPVRLLVGGDLLLTGAKKERVPLVNQLSPCEKIANPRNAWEEPLLSILGTVDAVFANLETPLSDKVFTALRHSNGFVKGSQAQGMGFQTTVKSPALDILSAAHISALSLSNNHMLDIPSGVYDTIDALKERGIPFAGAGLTLQEAMEPKTIATRHHHNPNRKISFLSASDLRSIRDEKTGFDETADF
eukprot:scaffold46295_cov206-Amphora_coffeaeformis.AAC.1